MELIEQPSESPSQGVGEPWNVLLTEWGHGEKLRRAGYQPGNVVTMESILAAQDMPVRKQA